MAFTVLTARAIFEGQEQQSRWTDLLPISVLHLIPS